MARKGRSGYSHLLHRLFYRAPQQSVLPLGSWALAREASLTRTRDPERYGEIPSGKSKTHKHTPPFTKTTQGTLRTKNATESEFRYGEQIRYRCGKTLRRGLRSACFSRKKMQENGTDTEKLQWRQQHNMDSSAVLFLVRKGPWVPEGN